MYKNENYKTYINVSYLYCRQEGTSKTINHGNKWRFFFSIFFWTFFLWDWDIIIYHASLTNVPLDFLFPLYSLNLFPHSLSSFTHSLPSLLRFPYFLSSSLTHFLSSSLPLPVFLFPFFLHSLSSRSPSSSLLSLVLHSFFIHCLYLFIPLFSSLALIPFLSITLFPPPLNPLISCLYLPFFVISSHVCVFFIFFSSSLSSYFLYLIPFSEYSWSSSSVWLHVPSFLVYLSLLRPHFFFFRKILYSLFFSLLLSHYSFYFLLCYTFLSTSFTSSSINLCDFSSSTEVGTCTSIYFMSRCPTYCT